MHVFVLTDLPSALKYFVLVTHAMPKGFLEALNLVA